MTDEERKQAGEALFAKWSSKAMTELQASASPRFAAEMGPLAFDNHLANGCTLEELEELEEVIYQSTAYAGFPAANCARAAATEAA